jgi:hypothetical protein
MTQGGLSMKKTIGLFILALVGVLALVACGPTQEIPVTGDDLPEAAQAARQLVASTLGVDIGQIEITAIEAQEWPDVCLGLPEEGEACAQVVTPGYEVRMEVNGQEYIIRTDELGQIIRSGDLSGLSP